MMFTTAVKIYLVTNLVFLLGISIYSLPEGLEFALFAAPFSLIFSAPLILLIAGVLWLLHKSRLPVMFCWLFFLLAIAGMTLLPFYWQGLHVLTDSDTKIIVVWAYFGAFTSVVVFHKAVHRFFQPVQTTTSNVKREPWSL